MTGLAELRRALLHAETRDEAVAVVTAFLVRTLGPAATIANAVTLATEQLSAETVRDVLADLKRTIALVDKEVVLRQTTEALFKDAGAVVRVLGELERRDAALKAELQSALRFQRAMLEPLPHHERLGFDAVYLAAEVISADFYDVAVLGPDHVRIFVADATGHGIAAGLATMFIKAEYEAQKRIRATTSALVGEMNELLTSRYELLDLRCTAICVDVHPAAERMCFTSAAHPGPVVARAGGFEVLPGGGTFIGLQPGVSYGTTETRLVPGDLVAVFSDGLLDAHGADGKAFGEGNVGALAVQNRATPDRFCSSLVSELSRFVGEGRSLLDDVTVVAMSARPPGQAGRAPC